MWKQLLGCLLIMVLAACSGVEEHGGSGETNAPLPEEGKKYVVLTEVRRQNDYSNDLEENMVYDALWQLVQAEVSPPRDDVFRGNTPLVFLHENERLTEVDTSSHSFNDIDLPRDYYFSWSLKVTYQDELPSVLMGSSEGRIESLGEVLSRNIEVNHDALTWDESNRLVSRHIVDADEQPREDWFFDYSLTNPVEARSIWYGGEQPYEVVRHIYLDEQGRVATVEVTYPNPATPIVNIRNISLKWDFMYGEDGQGQITWESQYLDREGTAHQSTGNYEFRFELVSEPGMGAFVLDPVLGPQVLSPFYFPYGGGYSSLSVLTL